MIYFKEFRLSGKTSQIAFDEGLESSKEEPKRLLSILVQVSGYDPNVDVAGYFEREKTFALPSSLIDTTEDAGTTNSMKSFNRINEIEVGIDLPVGSKYQVAISCGSTAKDLIGAYRYEIIK